MLILPPVPEICHMRVRYPENTSSFPKNTTGSARLQNPCYLKPAEPFQPMASTKPLGSLASLSNHAQTPRPLYVSIASPPSRMCAGIRPSAKSFSSLAISAKLLAA
jgi:hypothetical protein